MSLRGQLTFLAAMLCASSLHILYEKFSSHPSGGDLGRLDLRHFRLSPLRPWWRFRDPCGLCFKEYFCFRVPGLRAQPILLAALWLALALNVPFAAQGLAALSALLFLVTAFAKWRMPLHYDIGDKTKYEI